MIKDVTQSLRIGVITVKLLMKFMPLIHVNHSHTDLAEGIQIIEVKKKMCAGCC